MIVTTIMVSTVTLFSCSSTNYVHTQEQFLEKFRLSLIQMLPLDEVSCFKGHNELPLVFTFTCILINGVRQISNTVCVTCQSYHCLDRLLNHLNPVLVCLDLAFKSTSFWVHAFAV